tara:strand:+ start:351 stop:725 length:375 start_codon:yes stop_codon:yes gene_type:complete
MQIMLWSKLGCNKCKEYCDEILMEEENIIIIKFFGQRSGRRDNLIVKDAGLCIMNERNERVYIGKVLEVIPQEKINNINVYKLIVLKENEDIIAKTKNGICSLLNLSRMNNFERTNGITKHNIS